jgi:hypothetical protein
MRMNMKYDFESNKKRFFNIFLNLIFILKTGTKLISLNLKDISNTSNNKEKLETKRMYNVRDKKENGRENYHLFREAKWKKCGK